MKTIIEKREFIREVDVDKKNDFLFELLHNNERLMARFEEFVKDYDPLASTTKRKLNPLAFEDELIETYEAFKEGLSELDFTEVTPRYKHLQQSETSTESKTKADIAQFEAKEFYGAWQSDFLYEISSGYIYQALAMVYGMMAAAIEAEITDPEHFLGKSANKFFISLLTEDLQSLITNYFEVGETDPKDVLTITDITLNFVKKHNIGIINHYLPFFENVVTSPELADSIITKLKDNVVPVIVIPELTDLLTSRTGKVAEWRSAMESIFPENYKMTLKLLNYYYNHAPEEFDHMAMNAFKRYSLKIEDFIENKIKQGSPLYCQLWLAKASESKSFSDYSEARKYITKEESINFAKEQEDIDFKLQILTNEKAWDEILIMAKSKQSANLLHKLLPIIVEYHPDDCYQILKNNIVHLFRHQRHREGYVKLAQYLKFGQTILENNKQMEDLIVHYQDLSQKLPALKDELRNYGL